MNVVRKPAVVTRVHTRYGYNGLAIDFLDGKPAGYKDPFEVAQLLDDGGTVWVLDRDSQILMFPSNSVEYCECVNARNVPVVEDSEDPTVGPRVRVVGRRATRAS